MRPRTDALPPGGLTPGTPVAGRFTKWGERPHWQWTGVYVGTDEHGHWWYAPPGTRCVRPGADFVGEHDWVSLAPHEGAWAAGFYPDDKEVSVYVDMSTAPRWQRRDPTLDHWGADGPEWEVTMVDLDLDVVLTREGHLFVDDEDEFDEHRLSLGYPPEVVALARATRDTVLAAVARGDEPFGSVGHAWLHRARTIG